MGFNINNNYGPLIDNHNGGVVHLHQEKKGHWKVDAEDAVVIEEDRNQEKQSLSKSRQDILDQLLSLSDQGDWKDEDMAESVKMMLRTVLGQGDTLLTDEEAEQSEALWNLLEHGRRANNGRVKIVWQNIVGFLDSHSLFIQKGSPALNKDFFGDNKGYTNIDHGRPGSDSMSTGFKNVVPLLEKYVPKN